MTVDDCHITVVAQVVSPGGHVTTQGAVNLLNEIHNGTANTVMISCAELCLKTMPVQLSPPPPSLNIYHISYICIIKSYTHRNSHKPT